MRQEGTFSLCITYFVTKKIVNFRQVSNNYEIFSSHKCQLCFSGSCIFITTALRLRMGRKTNEIGRNKTQPA